MNKCILLVHILFVLIFLFILFVIIIPSHNTPIITYHQRNWELPRHAKLIGDDIYHLGKVRRKDKIVNSYIKLLKIKDKNFIYDNNKNQETCMVPPIFSSGWNGIAEPYGIDPSNPFNISHDYIITNIQNTMNQWNNATACKNPVGSYNSNIQVNGKDFTPDGNNEIFFGNAGNPTIIAVTFLWGNNDIVESDIMFNTGVTGGNGIGDATISNNVYDFITVSLHEIGHYFGADHPLPTLECQPTVMYPTLGLGITKRNLTSADTTLAYNLYCGTINNSNIIAFHWILLIIISIFLF